MAVTTAEHALATADANLAGATLTAPITGTVASVAFTSGASASTGAGIVVVGAGAALVTVDVPLTTLPRISKGLAATVTPAGATNALTATVDSIGLLPASTTGSSPTYPVAVLVPEATQALSAGSRADVSIVVARTSDVVTVPASAVTTLATATTGSTGIVRLLVNGVVTDTRVTTGAVGGGLVQVSTGLTAGQVVVLADATEALPTSSTSSTRTGLTGLGGTTRQGVTGGTFGGGTGGAGFGGGAGGAPPGN